MKVYIELVILDNFLITFLLAKLSYRIISEYPKKWRLFTASGVGTAAAVFYPFITHTVWLVVYKIAVGAAISLILFRPKKLLFGSGIFFLLTFSLGGAMIAVGYFVYGSVEKALTLPLVSLPLGVILFAAYLFYILIKVAVRKLFKRRDIKQYLYDAEIHIFGKSLRCKAFLDSGNRMYDDSSGLPIVVASIGALSEGLSDERITQLMTGKTKDFKGAHYVDCSTVSGRSKMLVFRPDGLVVYNGDKKNIINDVMLGVSFKRISDVESYGLILNPAVMTGENIC